MANFPANTGYAWGFIENVYGALADHFASADVSTWVAYPRIDMPPATLAGSAARAVELEVDLSSTSGLRHVLRFVREHDIRAVYLTDRAAWDLGYLALRLAGVRWIVVHDHTSGQRTPPAGLKRLLKLARRWVRGAMSDRVIAVSDFVANRKIEVDLVSPDRVRRIWNTCEQVERDPAAGRRLRDALGLCAAPVVACACRATPEKGVAHLLRAFDRYCVTLPPETTRPALVYFGDGPAMVELKELSGRLASSDQIVLAGYRPDARELIAGADVCVVPSIWQEAFGLAVLEPMTYGIPVIASRVGGIPEIVIDGETGVLTEPGDEAALEAALRQLLDEPPERERMGRRAQQRARAAFDRSDAVQELIRAIEPGLTRAQRPAAGRTTESKADDRQQGTDDDADVN